MTVRAVKGGQFGANGSWYEGGRFLNTIAENEKQEARKSVKRGKKMIAPYTWEVQPTADSKSIYVEICDYAKMIGEQVVVIESQFVGGFAYNGESMNRIAELCNRYNAGERWVV